MNRLVVAICVAALLVLMIPGSLSTKVRAANDFSNIKASTPVEEFVPGRVLVKFRKGVVSDHARQVIAALGAREDRRIAGSGVHILELPLDLNEKAYVNSFQGRPEVEFAELDKIVAPADIIPNDPWYRDAEWHLRKISAPSAWSSTTGNSSITVAILDTGVNGAHPDLAGNMVAGWNVYDNDANSDDVHGHGTLVAGTAAAVSNNGVGVASVAWNCRIMPVRITDLNGYATHSTIASGLTWAADHGARVANLSFTKVDGPTVTAGADYFRQKGGVVVSAAGNDGTYRTTPDNTSIFNVSATDTRDNLYSWSTRGDNIDVAAPGSVYSTDRSGGYLGAAGTSVAAPIVVGVAALVLSVNPSLNPQQVQDIIKRSADDLGTKGWDGSYGSGRVNASQAVEMAAASNSDTISPNVQFNSPWPGAQVSGNVDVQVAASDNVGVSTINFSVDGVLRGSASGVSAYLFSWDAAGATNGTHVLSASAADAAGNVTTTTIAVEVNNAATPLSITITSPGDSTNVTGTIPVLVDVTSSVAVAKVELYVDGKLSSNVTSAPFTNKWNTRKEKGSSHTLQCVVYDKAGGSAQSQVVHVTK